MINMQPILEGVVTGAVRMWLRAEGLAALVLSLLLYGHSGMSWWIFFLLLLTPDVSMLPYLVNPKLGAISYNVAHSYLLPLGLVAGCVLTRNFMLLPYLYIWTAHLGLDRSLGYGLKYPAVFGKTHLGIRQSRA